MDLSGSIIQWLLAWGNGPWKSIKYPFVRARLMYKILNPFPNNKILDWSKLKEFADVNFKCDENGRKFSKWLENTVGKGEIARHEQFSHSVFKRLVLQARKNQGLFEERVNHKRGQIHPHSQPHSSVASYGTGLANRR